MRFVLSLVCGCVFMTKFCSIGLLDCRAAKPCGVQSERKGEEEFGFHSSLCWKT